MAANEISERLAAGCWLRVQPIGATGTDADPSTLGFRSMVGFDETMYIRQGTFDGLMLLRLDREFNRRETAVHLAMPNTVSDVTRETYPGGAFGAAIQPFHFDWLGADYGVPDWMPFDIGLPVPLPFDLDLYNGIALLISAVDEPVDLCVTVLECPLYRGTTIVEAVLPPGVG